MRSGLTGVTLAMVVAAGCSADAPRERGARGSVASNDEAAKLDPPSPKLRLPTGIMPIRESVDLVLTPSEDGFRGSVDLELRVVERSRFLWLNATDLEIREAALVVGDPKSAPLPVRVVRGNEGYVGFAFDTELSPGVAHLRIRYDGKVSPKDDRGVFRETEDGHPYLFSQFENIEARRAFPCFDEPGFKHPWKISISVEAGDVAVSNTPIETETKTGARTVIHFAETKPIPAYLVAFAVGPFAFVDAGKTKAGTQVRIVTPGGRETEAEYAAKTTAPIIDELEGYFGIRYPYEKMDIVTIPHLVSFGAMENAGMITIGMAYSLAKHGDDTLHFQRLYTDVMAHELAHQWFGDLVTTAWWDDIWLNEGFATWMGNKIVRRLHPEWHFDFSRLHDASSAMEQDSLISARKIRQEIQSEDDIQNAFDGITYEKGATILGMFEHSVGEAAFQKGIQTYLAAHAFGLSTSADFLGDVSRGSGASLSEAFSTFLDRPGVPLLHTKIDCKDGPKLEITQERYLPIGSKGSSDASWRIPVCVTYEQRAEVDRHSAETARFVSDESEVTSCGTVGPGGGSIKLGSTCPKWVMPNAAGTGYYRVAYSASDLRLLLGAKSPISAIERMSVALDMAALVRAGKLPIADALAHVPELSRDTDIHVAGTGVALANLVRDPFLTDATRPAFAKVLERAYGAKARALGFRPRARDTAEDRLQRGDLVSWLANRADDPELVKQALVLTNAWLDDEKTLEQESVAAILGVAAQHGDRKLFDRMVLEAKKAKDDHRRGLILEALADFRDPEIATESMKLLLSDDFDIREAFGLLFGGDHRSDDARFAFVKKNYDTLLAKIPNELKPEMASTGRRFCDEAHRGDLEAFFGERMAKVTGGPRKLAQVVESIDLCIAEKKALGPSLDAFLKK